MHFGREWEIDVEVARGCVIKRERRHKFPAAIMDDDTKHSLVVQPDGSLGKAAGVRPQFLAQMVEDALAIVRMDTAIEPPSRFRIGDHDFCEPDYRQVLLWAGAMNIEPLTVLERLFDDGTFFGIRGPCYTPDLALFRFKDGKIETLFWDRRLLPLRVFEWVEGLEITSFSFCKEEQPSWAIPGLSLPLPKLRKLSCEFLGLTELDLSRVGNLEELECSGNYLTGLDLSFVPSLRKLKCSDNPISELNLSSVPRLTKLVMGHSGISQLDLSKVPNLITLICNDARLTTLELSEVPRLTELECSNNHISDLNLSRVPDLVTLDCCENALTDLDLSDAPQLASLFCAKNMITELDIRSLEHLEMLYYDEDTTRLIQRIDQSF